MRHAVVAVLAATLLATAGCAQAGPPPPAAEVQRLIRGPRTDLTFTKTEVGAPFRATKRDAEDYETDLGQYIWPVHVVYVARNGMYVRDTDNHWVAFKSRIKQGGWDVSGASRPGDTMNELRP